MAEFTVKIKINYEKEIDKEIDKMLKKFFKVGMMPELEKIIKEALFIRNRPTSRMEFDRFMKSNAGLFTKLLLNSPMVDRRKSTVKYSSTAKIEEIDVDLSTDEKTANDLLSYPENVIAKKLMDIDKSSEKIKFTTSLNKGDF